MEIHIQIKQARTEANLTQEKLGEMVGLPRTRINSLESGKCNPTVETLHKLAEALGCTFSVKAKRAKL